MSGVAAAAALGEDGEWDANGTRARLHRALSATAGVLPCESTRTASQRRSYRRAPAGARAQKQVLEVPKSQANCLHVCVHAVPYRRVSPPARAFRLPLLSHHAALAVPTDVDWASVDQVSALVSRTTLAGMQQLWRQHASSMDLYGRQFAEHMYASHTQVVKVGARRAVQAERARQAEAPVRGAGPGGTYGGCGGRGGCVLFGRGSQGWPWRLRKAPARWDPALWAALRRLPRVSAGWGLGLCLSTHQLQRLCKGHCCAAAARALTATCNCLWRGPPATPARHRSCAQAAHRPVFDHTRDMRGQTHNSSHMREPYALSSLASPPPRVPA